MKNSETRGLRSELREDARDSRQDLRGEFRDELRDEILELKNMILGEVKRDLKDQRLEVVQLKGDLMKELRQLLQIELKNTEYQRPVLKGEMKFNIRDEIRDEILEMRNVILEEINVILKEQRFELIELRSELLVEIRNLINMYEFGGVDSQRSFIKGGMWQNLRSEIQDEMLVLKNTILSEIKRDLRDQRFEIIELRSELLGEIRYLINNLRYEERRYVKGEVRRDGKWFSRDAKDFVRDGRYFRENEYYGRDSKVARNLRDQSSCFNSSAWS
jgi:hypothetical protein